jgi:aryl sulfotransferase
LKRITWLASYPKSGNTWMRVFFTNLQRDEAAPADINELLPGSMMAGNRDLFLEALGYDAADLTHDEIDRLRPKIYLYHAAKAQNPLFCKVHDAYAFLADGEPLFPPAATAGVIYLIRNPLDVCVSYMHHFAACTYDQVIAWMGDPHFAPGGRNDLLELQLRQRSLTWSGHVLSWVNAPNLRVLVIRYEDMKARAVETFTTAAAFVGMTQDQARITRALESSSFEELQRQERANGFREAGKEKSFFRKGKVGSWREELTASHVARIIKDHREVMLRFGYLTEAGEPSF